MRNSHVAGALIGTIRQHLPRPSVDSLAAIIIREMPPELVEHVPLNPSSPVNPSIDIPIDIPIIGAPPVAPAPMPEIPAIDGDGGTEVISAILVCVLGG